MHPEASMQIQR